ncbi:MAG: hypothetical protein V2I76_09280 [Roseobacter sp.]|jgi:hypothetical protein|nr:hypothetical protein [Roseobacter sp.]
MVRMTVILALVCSALPAVAQENKEETCGYQGAIAKAVQDARLDGVRERRVERAILSDNPAWPENYNNAIPTIASWVYQIDKGQLRDNDLGMIWNEQCVTNWDAIQQMLNQQAG